MAVSMMEVWVGLVVAGGALCLATVFHRRYGQRYLRLWALSWLAAGFHTVVDAVDATGLSIDATMLASLRALGLYAHCVLVGWGVYEAGTSRRVDEMFVPWAHGAILVLVVLPVLPFGDPLLVSATVVAAVTGVIYLGTGLLAVRWLGDGAIGAAAASSAFVMYGLLQFERLYHGRVLHPVVGLDFLVNLLIEYILAMGLVIWLLELAKEQAVRATADFHRAQEVSLKRFRRLLERGWDVVELRRPDGELEWVSQSVERVLGIPASEYLDAPPYDWVHPHDRPAMKRLLVGEPSPLPVPIRLRDQEGNTRHMEAVAMDLTDDPEVGAIVVTSRDVSDRYRLRRELLDAGVRERRALGRRLHDGLGQVLTGIGFRVAQLETTLERASSDAAPLAKEIKSLVQMAVSQADSLARGVSPVSQRVEGLATALESLADMVGRLYGVECTVGAVEIDGIEPGLGDQLYFIAAEALHSVIGGHGSRRVEVGVRRWEEGGAVVVTGHACGRGDGSPVRDGMRRRLMEYRASAIDAVVDPVIAHGNSVTIRCRFRHGTAASDARHAG
ncbi:MAG: histidine kinase [Gemmatimonadota bacterium]|nr:histidine kinase [Gemmatimonadota bacterium]